jgi:hypothetical protein
VSRQRGAWTPQETLALVELATTLGVQLDPGKDNVEALRACTEQAQKFVSTCKIILDALKEFDQ